MGWSERKKILSPNTKGDKYFQGRIISFGDVSIPFFSCISFNLATRLSSFNWKCLIFRAKGQNFKLNLFLFSENLIHQHTLYCRSLKRIFYWNEKCVKDLISLKDQAIRCFRSFQSRHKNIALTSPCIELH